MDTQPHGATVGIVGAGPAGLVLAHLLQRDGVPFVLLERSPSEHLGRRPKAGMIEYRTVELLKREGLIGTVLPIEAQNYRCEFRTPLASVVIDYGALTGGRHHYVYPQHRLVDRLYQTLVESGADVRCGHAVDTVTPDSASVVLSGACEGGKRFAVRCGVAVGCEGAESVVAAAMSGLSARRRRLPVRWLAVIGEAAPLENHTIYAAHPRGFAGHMRRDLAHTRYYLEVSASESAADWTERRIRDELSRRLLVEGQLDTVRFGDISFVDLRMQVVTPMQDGRLYLAGDAAHLITPAGAKGMNLAIQDAVELEHGLVERFGAAASAVRLSTYTTVRSAAVWRAQAFSEWFLRIIQGSGRDSAEAGAPIAGAFADGIRDAWVAALQNDPLLVRWFAHSYAGVDLD